MRPGPDAFARVVHEEREIKNVGIGQRREKLLVGLQFRFVSLAERVELLEADQGVLVRRVTMEIFMLHKAGEGTEFRQITPEKIDLVHHAQDARDFSLAPQNARENLARRLAVTKFARHGTQAATEEIGEFRAQLQLTFLRVFERLHQLLRFPGEKLRIAHV